jgi:hypothetical protein
VVGDGRYTAFSNGSVHAAFDDRTLLSIGAPNLYGGLFFVAVYFICSVTVMGKAGKGAYLEIVSS